MRICLDASPAIHHRAGVGRYTQELTTALLASGSGHEFAAFYNRSAQARLSPPFDGMPRLSTSLSDKRWRLSVLLAHLGRAGQERLFPGVALFHATDHLLPCFRRMKTVFTLYDLTFRTYPSTHAPLNRWFLTLMVPRFLRAAGAITAISESTRRDAEQLYGIDPAKITVVYPGVSPRFHPVPPERVMAVRVKYRLPERFILSVATLEPRKNLTALLEAFAALVSDGGPGGIPEARLVLVGRQGWLYEGFFRSLHELGLENRALLLGFVPDDDLPGLYSAAELFVYPSLYEGFGLPVLEAMACCTPVVCSNTSSLPEVAGDAALMVDPTDTTALAQAIQRALTDMGLRQTLRRRGPAQAAPFTWKRTARETLAVYERALDLA